MSQQKCKHQSCTCVPAQGEDYCSQKCRDSKGVTELACECGHPGCAGEKLTGASSR